MGNRIEVKSTVGTSVETTTYSYDTLNRLTYMETRDGLNQLISSYDYTLAATGHRTQVIDHTGATTSHSYDDLYRLTGEDLINHPVLPDSTNSYTYDPTGNRTYATEQDVSTAYRYDTNDRLLTAGGESYTYDNNGNTLTVDRQHPHYQQL